LGESFCLPVSPEEFDRILQDAGAVLARWDRALRRAMFSSGGFAATWSSSGGALDPPHRFVRELIEGCDRHLEMLFPCVLVFLFLRRTLTGRASLLMLRRR
jgi:hypothetical protein